MSSGNIFYVYGISDIGSLHIDDVMLIFLLRVVCVQLFLLQVNKRTLHLVLVGCGYVHTSYT